MKQRAPRVTCSFRNLISSRTVLLDSPTRVFLYGSVLVNESRMGSRWGFGKIPPLRSDQMIIQIMNNDALKKNGRSCPRIKYAERTSVSVHGSFPWIRDNINYPEVPYVMDRFERTLDQKW